MENVQVQAKKSFYEYTKGYNVKIENDNGFHRCILFTTPGTSEGYFRIITAPGVLIITGDYGDFIFSRNSDMIDFFGDTSVEPRFHYWKEKVVAGKTENFSREVFMESVYQEFKDWAEGENLPLSKADALMKAFRGQSFDVEDETTAFQAWNDFDASEVFGDGELTFPSGYLFEGSYREITFHYAWCCYAVQWATEQYRNLKAQ